MFKSLTLKQAAIFLSTLLILSGCIFAGGMHVLGRTLQGIEYSWIEFQIERSEKARLETSLRAVLGYGGMIHDFKNYILRKDDAHLAKVTADLNAARTILSQYTVLGPGPAEQIAIQDITRVLSAYTAALPKTVEMIQHGKTARDIDTAIVLDDTPALRGLNILHTEIQATLRQYKGAKPGKTALTARLRASMGYGGMIHAFKNYLLRRDPRDAEHTRVKIREARGVISAFMAAPQTAGERAALEDIQDTLSLYEHGLVVIQGMPDAGNTAEAVDLVVKVDDTPALRGLNTLDREIANDIQKRSLQISNILSLTHRSAHVVVWATVVFATAITSMALWLILKLVISPIRAMTRTMTALADGDLQVDVTHTDLNNEIGTMARTVKVFKRYALRRMEAEHQLADLNEELNAQIDTLQTLKNRSEQQTSQAISLAESLTKARNAADQATARAEADELRMRTILDTVTDAIITIDSNGRIETFNPAAQAIFGWTAGEVIGRNINMLMPDPMASAHDFYLKRFFEEQSQGRPSRVIGRTIELDALRHDGSVFPIGLSLSVMRIGDKTKFTGVARDITERRQAEDEIRRLAMTDPLTGLANRNQFMRQFHEALALAQRHPEWSTTLLMVDLDKFKPVNDTFGHPVGDALLKNVAGILKELSRETDTVARLGGDEFALILIDSGSRTTISEVCKRIVDGLCTPMTIKGHTVQIGGSIGVAISPDDGTDSDDLVRKADLALYAAKDAGRNTWCFFDTAMDQRNPPTES
ncbi:MAG: diguanylate cyclase [Rhodospirillaceae bacterium]|nr:diguanylate cyclase [Rhodospirillaceae bacterium]